MGRQIQHLLAEDDEGRLIQHLQARFPIVVVDSTYPPAWDRHTLARTAEASDWVIVDERTIPILTRAAVPLAAEHPRHPGGWGIRSRACSCVDWTRSFHPSQPHGRLYMNTTPDPIGAAVSAAAGDDIARMYDRACRWIRANCVNCTTSRRGLWVSPERVAEYRTFQVGPAAERSRRPRDPRDKRFYQLRRKPVKQLTTAERETLVRYCDAMLVYVAGHPEAVSAWQQYRYKLLGPQ